MPELPEVETVRRSLIPLVVSRRIKRVEVLYGGIIKKPHPAEFVEMLAGRKIVSLERRGKYLLFQLSENYTLVAHLRMTGRFWVCPAGAELAKHTHVIFHLDDHQELRFVDIRKFGLFYLVPAGKWSEAGGLATLGPEPLAEDFTYEVFRDIFSSAKGRLKAFLLDQTRLAGIGNIYADEILFAAKLHPERNLTGLKDEEIQALYQAIRAVLQRGVDCRGTSVRDYVDGRGQKGSFQKELKVYDQAGKDCVACGTKLVKRVVAGRGTVFCPKCQGDA